MNSLDLYAKVEHLLGIEDATRELHNLYKEELEEFNIATLLDFGCGRGSFMKLMQKDGIKTKGIDKSLVMVEHCQKDGLDVRDIDLKDVDEKFDAIVAIFDVLNFFNPKELKEFLDTVATKLNDNGVFLADVNTLYGFSEVAQGCMSVSNDKEVLVVDAIYEDEKLNTNFLFFEKTNNGCYTKHQENIVQYFHKSRDFEKIKNLKLIQKIPFSLYDTKDKLLLIFKKQNT